MKTLKKIWVWVKKHWKIVIGVLVTILVSTVYILGKKSFLDEALMGDRKKIIKKKKEITVLEAEKDLIRMNIDRVDADINKVDEKILSHKKEIGRVKDKISELKRHEKLRKFKDMGY